VKRLLSALVVALSVVAPSVQIVAPVTATAVILWAQPAAAIPALVQSAKSTAACSTSCTATFSGATTAGNTIIAVVSEFFSFTNFSFTNTISDGTNSPYLVAYTHDNGANGPSIKVSYFENAASVTVITSTSSTGSQFEFIVMEVSGLATSSSLDQAGGYHQDVSTTAYTSGSITTTQASEFVLGAHLLNNSGTISATPSGSFSTVTTNTSNNPTAQTQYFVTSSTGSYTSAGSWTVSGTTDSAIVSFKASGGGGGGTVCTPTISTLGVGRCGDEVH
jgi:hypothetical protein